jgi:hypothetical protein
MKADVDFHWPLSYCIDNPDCSFLCGNSVGSSDGDELWLLTLPVHLSSPLTTESRAKDRAVARDPTALAVPRLLNRWHLAPNPTE